jgi:hypothetical protein
VDLPFRAISFKLEISASLAGGGPCESKPSSLSEDSRSFQVFDADEAVETELTPEEEKARWLWKIRHTAMLCVKQESTDAFVVGMNKSWVKQWLSVSYATGFLQADENRTRRSRHSHAIPTLDGNDP